ncbi:MAG: hypothetical protein ABW321_27050 [Polyangiales bacterium]
MGGLVSANLREHEQLYIGAHPPVELAWLLLSHVRDEEDTRLRPA